MKNDNEFESSGVMYKATAFAIFVILVVLIVLISVSYRKDNVPSTDDQTSTAQKDTISDTQDIDPSGTTASDTTASDTTSGETAAPVTDAPVTSSPDTTSPDTATTPVSGDTVEAPSTNTPQTTLDYLSLYPDTVLAETADAGQAYIDKLVFLGDSTTYGLRAYKMLAGGKDTTQVWTPKIGTLTLSQASFATIVYPETDEELTIADAVAKKKPEYLVITLGVNGVAFMKEDYFKSEYKKIIDSVQTASPDTKIICQSIFPVAKSYARLDSINNDLIDAANKWICEIAAECGVKYLDTNSALRYTDGWLPEDYHNGDGMHLQTNSFTIELNNIRTHAWPGEADAASESTN